MSRKIWCSSNRLCSRSRTARCALPLRPPALVDTCDLELQLEGGVKAALQQHVAAGGPGGRPALAWDLDLEHVIMPALWSYEHEAVTGESAPGAAELQSAIKRATPLGWVFKGAPSFHLNASAPAVAAALLGDASVLELLALAAGVQGVELSCRWAFRSRVQLYPEGLFAVWVMLAVKFRDTATVGSGHGG